MSANTQWSHAGKEVNMFYFDLFLFLRNSSLASQKAFRMLSACQSFCTFCEFTAGSPHMGSWKCNSNLFNSVAKSGGSYTPTNS